eukprot:3879498-Pyramimonas_sp.AAC.1
MYARPESGAHGVRAPTIAFGARLSPWRSPRFGQIGWLSSPPIVQNHGARHAAAHSRVMRGGMPCRSK